MKKIITPIAMIFLISFQLISFELFAGSRDLPVAEFQADLSLIPVGSSINFSDMSTGEPTTWNWTFEGGTPSTYVGKIPPQVHYSIAGEYDVKLIVVNAEGSDTLTKTDYIEVVDYPADWDYTQTGTSHIVSVPASVVFLSTMLTAGDFIGAFYIDENGDEKCGGANVWDGVNNKAVVAYGNDATTPDLKEGFDDGEFFIWKVFFTITTIEKYAFVTYNEALPNHDGTFQDNGLSSLTSIDTDPLIANATADPESICLGDEVQLNTEVEGGTGSYTFAWSSDPSGFSSDLQNPVDSPLQTTMYFVEVDDGNMVVSDSVLVEIISPTADAGLDQTSCESTQVSLVGTATNYSSVLWTSDGDGTFTGQATLNATYTPGVLDLTNGSVELTLTAQPVDPCTTVATSVLSITIVHSATADAGGDMDVCYNAGNPGFALDATVTNASGILWETAGDGQFDNDAIEDPVYTPGENDLVIGQVLLTLSAESFDPCTAIAESEMTLTFVFEAEAFAGNDASICPDETYELFEAAADNFSSLLWETDGDGEFDSNSSLNATYTPGGGGIANGSVELCLTAAAIDPCTVAAIDCIVLTILDNQQIVIPSGWSGLSGYLDPANPDIEVLLSEIVDDLMIMYNANGEIYQPAHGVNTVVDWNSYNGYYVKLENEVTLNICGSPVETNSLNLIEGWNVIPVLSDVDVPVDDVFLSVSDKVVLIQEIAGIKIWYPTYGIYSLENLMTGKAYLVKVTEAIEITYP